MNDPNPLLRIRPAKKTERLLFNLHSFNFFRKSAGGEAMMFFNGFRLLTLLIAVPYMLGCELAFFRAERYFIRLKEQVVAVFVLREKTDSLFIGSLAVAPEYRRCGFATHMLNYSARVAGRLGKSWVELTVLKKNISARQLYEKVGFVRKEERRHSLVLRKNVSHCRKHSL